MDKNTVDKIIDGCQEEKSEVEPELLQDFIVETKEHLENIEMSVLLLENKPDDIEIIHDLFRGFHTIKGLAGFVKMDALQDIAHQTETLLDDCRKGRMQVNKTVVDMVLASSDYIKSMCDNTQLNNDREFLRRVESHLKVLKRRGTRAVPNNEGVSEEMGLKVKKIGEILVEQGKLGREEIEGIVKKQKENYPDLKLGQVVIKEKAAEVKDVIKSIRIQEAAKSRIMDMGATDRNYIRIPAVKADNLVDMVGELLITHSLVEREAGLRFNSNDSLVTNITRMSRIMKDIQNVSMSLSMVCLKSTFQKITRIGRDAVSQLNKHVNIELRGEETEIDRGVAERLLDPLLHLVKNAISHGIESEEERAQRGKPPVGQVVVEAYSKSGNVYIEVSDDGKGISLEKVYKKALEKNLADTSITYSCDEIMNFIFLPGFSTAQKIDNISGRGVGLDVVKTEMSKIGGRIEVISKEGEGSRFILKIPVNLAVMDGTIVDIMGNSYIIPSVNVKQILKPTCEQWTGAKGRNRMVSIRDDILQVIATERIFGANEDYEAFKNELIVVIELEQKRKALPISNIIGKREIVVKPLGNEFCNLNFVSGASILEDGKVSLILDVETLLKKEAGN